MSTSKANVIEKINQMPDDMDEEQLLERLYMLVRLEHSRKRCEKEGVYSDEELIRHFAGRREGYI